MVTSAARASEPGVRLIPLPSEAVEAGNLYFQGDGEPRLLHFYTQRDSVIYAYQDNQWVLIRRELETVVPGLVPVGLSGDGERVVLTDFSRVDVVEGMRVITLAREWRHTERRNGRDYRERVFGWLGNGKMSADGRVVAVAGTEHGRHDTDSLVWTGGGELVNISDDLPREDHSYKAGIPDADGSVVVFAADTPEGDEVWRWEQGQLTQIPGLDHGSAASRTVSHISAQGDAVFGTEYGPRRGGYDYTNPLIRAEPWLYPVALPTTAWLWTQDLGTQEIIDRARFLETRLVDINASGSMALVHARSHGPDQKESWGRYLWLGEANFVNIDDLFYSLGISIKAQWSDFYELSDDGTRLMGLAQLPDNSYAAIIVTIPDLTP